MREARVSSSTGCVRRELGRRPPEEPAVGLHGPADRGVTLFVQRAGTLAEHTHVIWAIHWVNPLSPAVEAIRAPLFAGTMPFWGDALYLVVACAVALALGAFVFTRVDDQIAIEV